MYFGGFISSRPKIQYNDNKKKERKIQFLTYFYATYLLTNLTLYYFYVQDEI